jgi:choline-sulfatase
MPAPTSPFLLIASFLKPHDPFMPARRFAEMFKPEQMRLPDTWGKADLDRLPREVRRSIEFCRWTPELLHAGEARKRMAFYYGNLAQMDDCAGQVLAALERLGLDQNTIVVYTSDHGEMLGDLGLWNKFEFYEGSCGVLLSVRLPGSPAAQCDQPVSLISFRPTLAELCHVPLESPHDGRSIADLVLHPESHEPHGPVFAEFDLGLPTEKYMIRDGDFKYTLWVHDIAELYNLRSDPQEMRNLAADPAHQETAARLRQQILAWHRPAGI